MLARRGWPHLPVTTHELPFPCLIQTALGLRQQVSIRIRFNFPDLTRRGFSRIPNLVSENLISSIRPKQEGHIMTPCMVIGASTISMRPEIEHSRSHVPGLQSVTAHSHKTTVRSWSYDIAVLSRISGSRSGKSRRNRPVLVSRSRNSKTIIV